MVVSQILTDLNGIVSVWIAVGRNNECVEC